ncbi:conserved hypothetical protein [uncultured Stenotrophomonas sp.]|uniref:UPF0225 protein STPYR_12380 n=1 Tax=uncultured Stenotrophomonas sp. TaxID=165438 RepID=A0A1Y5Q5A1_9GAMM|nr:conserved hypothetical protein [uncultured Stenotrophomonas sp.]
MPIDAITPCPCGLGPAYGQCCGRYHAGAAAPDAEALMRSRYSAFVPGNADYLLASWHPTTRPPELSLDDPPGQRTQWLGLDVKRHHVTGADTAEVDFVARYRIGGARAVRMAEHSCFVREGGRWYYLDAQG